MTVLHQLHNDIALIGWSCRIPGAKSVADLWTLLAEGRCAISRVPSDRWSLERFWHPRRQEPGKSYTWSAGILEDVWNFDPSVFGISPREAESMDPQQRILLELTWEALEDAGIRPTSLSGTEVGVFVGGSSTDYGTVRLGDPASVDQHYATGNALSILSNRISYAYDLRGPSFTVDTACSSSLVAMHQAVEAIQSGRIDTAIVGGVNVLVSPYSFVSFSQASMLSPTGLCQAFSAKADGYVRSEGGVVFVLRRRSEARKAQNPIRGMIVATDVNSDGRTRGISMPSLKSQQDLLERVYARSGIDLDKLAFIEAHGTGTPVGDPVEARSIGQSIGQKRAQALPIGSIKTNVGHLEPASGLAGVLKALLSLNKGMLPRSLHFNEPNPNIEFDKLNLQVCAQSLPLTDPEKRYAGVNSFGFGGTNAHVVLAAGEETPAPEAHSERGLGYFAISAETKPALTAMAKNYARRLAGASDRETALVASAIHHRREHLSDRLVVSASDRKKVIEALEAFTAGAEDPRVAVGTALGNGLPVAFVYSGNGSQWVGMGQAAYRMNEDFREQFDRVDNLFKQLSGWSITEALFSDTLNERLKLTKVAQPLIFAIQSAATVALVRRGLRPSVVLGHSVGEVAAAEAAGIFDLASAVKIIHFRSTYQELVQGKGRMAAVLTNLDAAKELAESVPGIEIAAINSPRAITVAGPDDAIAALRELAKSRRIIVRDLDLDYPFHSSLMEPVMTPLLASLKGLVPREARITFVSTVTGEPVSGKELGAEYWWHNVREPVQFHAALRQASKTGARVFFEVGPRAMLQTAINDSIEEKGVNFAVLPVLDRNDQDGDPFSKAMANAIIRGGAFDSAGVFGSDPGAAIALPTYPWQNTPFRTETTAEINGDLYIGEHHPLAGARSSSDGLEWRAHLDTVSLPVLADHKIGDQIILPGTGFVEIALAVAKQWLRSPNVMISNFEILKPLDLSDEEQREVITRVSPGSNTLEILSRPRLAHSGWLLNARGKMFHSASVTETVAFPDAPARDRINHDAIYSVAAGSGAFFGPEFRNVQYAATLDSNRIVVELTPPPQSGDYLLDPRRLDSCFHGLYLLFPKLNQNRRGVAYIPVRFDETVFSATEGMPQRAIIQVKSANERSIVAHFTILDGENQTIAVIRGAHFQAISTQRTNELDGIALVEQLRLIDGTALRRVGVTASPADLAAEARNLGLINTQRVKATDDSFILEGWATAAAYEIASALAKDGQIDADQLIAGGRLGADVKPWLLHVLHGLEAAGLAKAQAGKWTLIEDSLLPSSASVLKALASEHPARAAELLLAGEISGLAARLSDPETTLTTESLGTNGFDFYGNTSPFAHEAGAALNRLLVATKQIWPKDRALRVLQVGYGPLTQELIATFESHDARLVVLETDRRRYEQAKIELTRKANVELVDAQFALEPNNFDLIVALESLYRLPKNFSLRSLRETLSPKGMLVAIDPAPSLFRNLVFGLDPSAFKDCAPELPALDLRSPAQWDEALTKAGFAAAQVQAVRCGKTPAILVAAKTPEDTAFKAPIEAGSDVRSACIVSASAAETSDLAKALATVMSGNGLHVSSTTAQTGKKFPDPLPEIIVQFVPEVEETVEPNQTLANRCMQIKACAERVGTGKAALWLIFSGAQRASRGKVHPVEAGVWAFTRTLANEFPNLDVRRIDVAPHLRIQQTAERIRDLILSGTAETEFLIDSNDVRVNRVESIKRTLAGAGASPAPAARLQRRAGTGQHLFWQGVERKAPAVNEIEIAVEATGVNFRDLMWMLSLLTDEMLEDGFTGPTLGLECSGRVAQVGEGVTQFKVGDPVLALAPSAFSTHVTVPANMAARKPDSISFEAAATIPVAFLTAYYSLVTLANVQEGEWVLVHGGAGGVGMAAIQIAHARGARVIATVGAKAKRDMLRGLGVAHVLNSRSTAFVDQIREITGSGVDIVLNSLAGEAMERGVASLKPFGRFIELGKRDYLANTHVGLRPFRKNLNYYGVDLDQLIEAKLDRGREIYAEVMRLIEDGTLTPLPYCVYPASEVWEAFHLMQQSGHIGKIIVRPPAPGTVRKAAKPFTIDARRTHLVTGASGGFGLEVAKWLVERGAKHLVLLGRRGANTPEAATALADFARRGVKVYAEPCDVADARQIERLFERIRASMPPLAGVIHAAMVLEDSLIANLDEQQLARVLRPKVEGAENLDVATRGLSLDYFVMFSSVTTMIGNPGQASYVAANGYMEGLARRRRQEGLPALAIGWGAIADVGVVAKSKKLQSSLKSRSGAKGIMARDALDLMAEALQQPTDTADLAVMTIAAHDWGTARERLAVLRSPTYSDLMRAEHEMADSATAKIDLRALLATEDAESVRRKVTQVIVAELARVLHSREEDVNRVRPLGEIGLDSLMVLELAMNLQDAFDIEIPFSGTVGSLTVTGLAEEVIAVANVDTVREGSKSDSVVSAVAGRHATGKIEAEELANLKELAEGDSKKTVRLIS